MNPICLYSLDYLCIYIRETLEFCGSASWSSKYLLWVLPVSLLLLHAYNPWLHFLNFYHLNLTLKQLTKIGGEEGRKETSCVCRATWANFLSWRPCDLISVGRFPSTYQGTLEGSEEFTFMENAGSRNGIRLLFSSVKLELRISLLWHQYIFRNSFVRCSFHPASSIFCIYLERGLRDFEVTIFYNLVNKDLVTSLAINKMYRWYL